MSNLVITPFLASLFITASALAAPHSPSVLVVVAHPDDESCMAATLYRIAQEQGGVVDQLVVTNGEGGYKYSLLAEKYYGKNLTREEIGRRELPAIRKQELLNAGKILGVRDHIFLDQKDQRYTTDPSEALQQWDLAAVKLAIEQQLTTRAPQGGYDLVMTLLPTEDTHGHHKAVALLALEAVNQLPSEMRKPIVLGCDSTREINKATLDSSGKPILVQEEEKRLFSQLKGFPLSATLSITPEFTFDRNIGFGFKKALSYQMIMSWVIAEHKSQGFFQTYYQQYRYEHFWYFKSNGELRLAEAHTLLDPIFPQP